MDEKPKLTVIRGTPAPDTPKERVRKELRKTRVPHIPQCPRCESRTFVIVQTADTKQKACAFCFMKSELVIMT
jgi:transcription elongation factor Elf1